MESADKAEFFRLLSALCDDQISSTDGERLADLLRESAELRVAYVRYVDLHASLDRMTAVSQAGAEFDTRLRKLEEELGMSSAPAEFTSFSTPASTTVGSRQRSSRLAAVAALASIAAAVGIAFSIWNKSDVVLVPPQPELTPVVAQLTSARDCTWASVDQSPSEGTSLRAGQRFTLTSGVARLVFNDQTTALVESPTSFELVSESSLRLHSGTVALRANGFERDFVVLTPSASIVDLGTSFGVHSGPDGVDVEVFEGAVEILPDNDAKRSRILGLGASARLASGPGEVDVKMFVDHQGRFTDLLQMLWEDVADHQGDAAGESPHAEFSAPEGTTAVDTFHGAIRGDGWVTPWVGSGNPLGQLARDDSISGEDNPYLKLRFFRSTRRTVAREYGPTGSFDPSEPHVISWVWRFDGTDPDFGDSFHDRIAFYGMPYFRDNSSEDTNWLIGWSGDHERVGLQRKAIPKRWVVFDGAKGDQYDPANLIDTGMELKPGVVYRMAVVLYPKTRQYDAIIQDDVQTFVRPGLRFRSRSDLPGKVVHFGVGTDKLDGDASFSLDSIRIEPLRPDLIPDELRFNVPSDPGSPQNVNLPAGTSGTDSQSAPQ